MPLLQELLKGSKAPNAQAAKMLSLLVAWRTARRQPAGPQRRDGKIDNPGAAIMNAAWPKIADAFMRPLLGPQLRASSAHW